MYLRFVADLIVLGLAFYLVLAILAVPMSLVQAILAKWSDDASDYWSGFATQVLVSVLFAAFIGASVAAFQRSQDPSLSWLYSATGFLGITGVLVDNARTRLRSERRYVLPSSNGAYYGASAGVFVGAGAFLLCLHEPSVILFLPGAEFLFVGAFELASWLTGFVIVRILAAIAAFFYLFRAIPALLFFLGIGIFALHSIFRDGKEEPAAE